MNAEATGSLEAIDAKSASTCTFWCFVIGFLSLGLLMVPLGRPFISTETALVVGGMERLGLLSPTGWSISDSPFATVTSGAMTVVGATERSLRLALAAALILGSAILAHGAKERGAGSAVISFGILLLPGAFSGVGIPFAKSTFLLALGSVVVWPLTHHGRGVMVAAFALAAAGIVAWLDPMAACLAALLVLTFIPKLETTRQRLTLGLFAVTLAMMAFVDPARAPIGRLGFDINTPGGLMLGTHGIFTEGRLAIVIPFFIVIMNQWVESLAILPTCGILLLILAMSFGVPWLVPQPLDPRIELDRVVAAMLPGDALVMGPHHDIWRIYARAGHVTRQHTLSIAPERRESLAEALRTIGARRAVICERSMLPIPDCDPLGDEAAGFPMVSPKPRRN